MRSLGLLTALTVALALTQPAFASTTRAASRSAERAANTRSTTLAGYDYNYYIGVPGAISAVIVVPKLSCTGTPPAGSARTVTLSHRCGHGPP